MLNVGHTVVVVARGRFEAGRQVDSVTKTYSDKNISEFYNNKSSTKWTTAKTSNVEDPKHCNFLPVIKVWLISSKLFLRKETSTFVSIS